MSQKTLQQIIMEELQAVLSEQRPLDPEGRPYFDPTSVADRNKRHLADVRGQGDPFGPEVGSIEYRNQQLTRNYGTAPAAAPAPTAAAPAPTAPARATGGDMPRRVGGMSTRYLQKRGYEWDPAKGTMMKGGRSVQDRQAAYKAGRTGAPATPAAAATAKPGEDYDALVAQQKDPVDYEAGTGFDSLEAQYPTDTTDVARARGLTSTDPVKGTAGDADEQIWSVDADTSLMSPAGYRSGEQSVLEPESAFRGRELQKSLPEDPGSAGYGQSIDPRSKPDKEDLVADEPFRFDRELRESKLNKVIMEEFTNLLNELAKKRI